MKIKLLTFLLTITSLSFSGLSNATTRFSVLAAPTTYTLSFLESTTVAADSDYTGLIWNLSFASADTPYFLDLSYQTSIDDGTEHSLFDGTSGLAPFDRSEFSVTLGYRLSKTSSMFTGYRTSTNTYENNVNSSSLDFTASGIFAGMSLGKAAGDNSAISVSAAAAFMSGELSGIDDLNIGVNGTADNTFGYKLSTSYSYFITDGAAIKLSLTYQLYEYTGWSGGIADLEEEITSAGIGFFITF